MKTRSGRIGGDVDALLFPVEETEAVIEAMSKAEKAGDLESLQWCARRMAWLLTQTDNSFGEAWVEVGLFNFQWETMLKEDPPPEHIAARFA